MWSDLLGRVTIHPTRVWPEAPIIPHPFHLQNTFTPTQLSKNRNPLALTLCSSSHLNIIGSKVPNLIL